MTVENSPLAKIVADNWAEIEAQLRVIPQPADANQLLTTDETAVLLGLSPRTLVNWRQDSRGPRYLNIGNLVRYRYADILKWIHQNE